MKSLFLRFLFSMWLAMALLAGAFAAIHAWAFPAEIGSQRQKFLARVLVLQGENALYCQRQGLADCERALRVRDTRGFRAAIYRHGELVMGEPVSGGAELSREVVALGESRVVPSEELELHAVPLEREPGHAVVSEGPHWSRWAFFFSPDTLVYRLLAIVSVSGLVAAWLARYLSAPVHALRRATRQMAAGDLSVRVAEQLRHADAETRALGRDLDRLAERIQESLESERRLRRDISHELRSPLTRLNIALELVRRRSPEDLAPAFDRIERDTQRLEAMIRELLTLNRLESESLTRGEPVDLAGLLREVVEDVALEAEQRGSRIVLEGEAAAPLQGNAELLRRALENVVRNAVRFTEANTDVEIGLGVSGGRGVVSVRDSGPGVPEASLPHLFEPFYRVDDDRARQSGGSGLGLAITERAVVLHGGQVRADNHPERGLVVTLELPLAQ